MLNRNPNKRLGAGPTDAEEIKKHVWFKGVNWNDVYKRKLKPPKPIIKKYKVGEFLAPPITQKTIEPTKNKVEGWSFIEFNK